MHTPLSKGRERKARPGAALLKPERLSPGDTVGIVTPASPPPDPKDIDGFVQAIERLGFKPKLAPHARSRHGFLAGTDRDRAADLMSLFADRRVKAVFCARGGYGAGRLLARLDYDAIRRHPKILLGFSDITALHCALLTKAKLVSFHGPTISSNLHQAGPSDFTVQCLVRTLTQPSAPGAICRGYQEGTVTVLRRGRASGPLLGGNLSLLCTLLATPYQPSFKNRILFFEDIDEPPYRFDRMLTHLLNAGLLQQVAGVAIGINQGCVDSKARTPGEYRQSLEDVLKERLLPLKVPIVAGLPFGHVRCNATLPIGLQATLDADHAGLHIDEPAVT
jgi:muramoyltetrapeptide carboxypeptidase